MQLFNEAEFQKFRLEHPELRFWQAMREYLYVDKIVIEYKEDEEVIREDTFFWQDDKKTGNRSRV